ncbi:MAG: Sulfatase-like hydrolase/transferase [Acidobacteriota bacterium]|nr:Sulfatase-like hydrolase/transferase [Acidobacteriota bacterium]
MKKYLFLVFCVLVFLFPGCTKKQAKPNILLITIDTLRRDHLGCYGYPLDTSPFIDSLAKHGVVYKNVVTPLPLTDGSHATILTSLHPLAHQVIRNATSLKDKAETIAEVLKKNGYYTIGTIAAFHLSHKYNFNQGFDSFSDTWDKNIKYNEHWFRVAESVNKSLFEQIDEYLEKHKKDEKEKDKPLFIWVHYYDPHTPYVNRKEITFESYEKDKKRYPFINYDKEIRYTDEQFKKLYGYLEEKGLSETLLTCITADHGEQLGDHGGSAVHHDFYSETTFVPLIFHGYNIPNRKIIEEFVSTMDIAVTLLGRANLNFEKPGHMHGINLLDPKGYPKPVPTREFLVIGDPAFVRSIQWLSVPYSYILNFDYMYKQWFVVRGAENSGLADRLIPVPQGAWREEYLEKSDKVVVDIAYPEALRSGLYFGVLRFDVEKDNGFSVGYRIGPANSKATYSFTDKKPGMVTITAIFPATPLDRLSGVIQRKKETRIANLKYALLPGEDALKYIMNIPGRIEAENRIFTNLKTQRKFKTGDELYNLESDLAMIKNILPGSGGDSPVSPALKERVVKSKKGIFESLRFYREETKKILGASSADKPLTDEEKKMLKSLGYL